MFIKVVDYYNISILNNANTFTTLDKLHYFLNYNTKVMKVILSEKKMPILQKNGIEYKSENIKLMPFDLISVLKRKQHLLTTKLLNVASKYYSTNLLCYYIAELCLANNVYTDIDTITNVMIDGNVNYFDRLLKINGFLVITKTMIYNACLAKNIVILERCRKKYGIKIDSIGIDLLKDF